MAAFPSLPLFTDAYLADAGHLTDAEHGRYFLLLMQMWRTPECRLPNDDEWLARRFRRTVEQVRADLRPIISEFMQTDGNWITQKRLRKEWEWCRGHSKKQSDIAKSRWNKEKGACHGNAPAGNAPTPIPTPTPIEERGSLRSPARKRAVRGTPLPDDWALSETDRAFAHSVGWSEAKTELESERFRDHSRSHGRLHKDISAAWRNWVRSPFQQQNGPRAGSKEDTRERTVNALDKLRRYVRSHADDDRASGEAGGSVVGLLPFAKPS